ncbi:hypothetical protein [Brevibacillus migulae]|uniref:hypothetical protein n=1 Tax=Brevibacillus migulae TaxID=1644114 RepID=UPI00106ED57D|nr:hypothetical protein [Brevibacillus migulae]
MFRNYASFYALQGSLDCPLHSQSRGSAKVVAATQTVQVAALFPTIGCSAWKGFAGAPFRNMLSSVAEALKEKCLNDRKKQCGTSNTLNSSYASRL